MELAIRAVLRAPAHLTWRLVLAATVTAGMLGGTLASAADALTTPKIYWANRGTNAIGVANLDGTGANQSLITGANFPFGLATDGQYIYWANDSTGTIGRANLDGTNVNQSFITGANLPTGVVVDSTHIYWANSGDGTIGAASLDGTHARQS